MHRTLALLLVACAPLETFDPNDKDPTDDVDTDDTTPADTDEPTRDTSVEPGDTADSDDTEDTDDTAPPTATIPPALAGANLLVNGGGELGDLTAWDVTSSGGDGLIVAGGGHAGNWHFATSYDTASREQTLDLLALGFTEAMLDAAPPIHVEEWVREHYCGPDEWTIGLRLLDGAGQEIDAFGESSVPGSTTGCTYADDTWALVEHTLTGYGPGVRTLVFYDLGVDIEFWAGHYGPRFDDASVSLSNP